MNKCLNCENLTKTNRNKYCSNKCQREYELKENPIEKYVVKCFKCEKEFIINERKNSYPKKEIYYCSRSCSNKRKQTEKTKKKISDGIKNV